MGDLFHVVQCISEGNGRSSVAARRANQWVYVSVAKKDIKHRNSADDYARLLSSLENAETKAADGEAQANEKPKEQEASTNSIDSGYTSDDPGTSDQHSEDKVEKAKADLANWILEHVSTKDWEKKSNSGKGVNVADWYNANASFKQLEVNADGEAATIPCDDLDEKDFIVKTLTPHMTLPKSYRNLSKIPWFSPQDLEVVSEADDMHLWIHPTVVKSGTEDGESRLHFLKLAAPGEEEAVKREIKFLHKLARLNPADSELRAPRLEGLVSIPSVPSSRAQILGFLLSVIPQPSQPLTKYMSSEYPQAKRDKWAAESEKMVKYLHDHGMIWGDAKADNFLVDKDDTLWIIDFGGSYTPGWVDPKLAGTKKGDKQALELLVEGVKDPENATVGDETLEADSEQKTDGAGQISDDQEAQASQKPGFPDRSTSRKRPIEADHHHDSPASKKRK